MTSNPETAGVEPVAWRVDELTSKGRCEACHGHGSYRGAWCEVCRGHGTHRPAKRAGGDAFRPMETWDKRDETVLLLVDYTKGRHPLDDAPTAITIGHNNDHNVGEGEGKGWEFAGWCWTHDHYVQGEGKPIGWMPLPHSLATTRPASPEPMTEAEHRLEDLKQMAAYEGPIVSFDVGEGFYLASCDHCGWVGSSERCGTDAVGDDSDVYCPRCHSSGADCGKVAGRLPDQIADHANCSVGEELVERVARALSRSFNQASGDAHWPNFVKEARAALAAMPTPAAIRAETTAQIVAWLRGHSGSFKATTVADAIEAGDQLTGVGE